MYNKIFMKHVYEDLSFIFLQNILFISMKRDFTVILLKLSVY